MAEKMNTGSMFDDRKYWCALDEAVTAADPQLVAVVALMQSIADTCPSHVVVLYMMGSIAQRAREIEVRARAGLEVQAAQARRYAADAASLPPPIARP